MLTIDAELETGRLSRELLLRTSERLQLATDAAAIGIWDWDLIRDELVWDDTMYGIYGVTTSSFSPSYAAWSAMLSTDVQERVTARLQAALTGADEYVDELEVTWPDGSRHVIKAAARVIRDTDGRALRAVGVNYDVTAQRKAAQSLAASEALLLQFIKHTPAAVAMLDRNLRYLHVSDRWLVDYTGPANELKVLR